MNEARPLGMKRLFFVFALCMAAWAVAALARDGGASPQVFAYYDGQVQIDRVKRFHWRVLETALERTRGTYGDYKLVVLPSAPVSRQKYELSQGKSAITVAAFNVSAGEDGGLVPVRIPVDQGLQSYRVLLIRDGDQARFDRISSLDDLRQLRFGLLPWWSDAHVMRANGMTLVEGQDYAGLFRMLEARRFDAFSRGVAEVLGDLDRGKQVAPGLTVERHLLIHYPLPVYFWFSSDREGRRRAERVQAGLAAMVADGSLAAMVSARYRADIEELGLTDRRVLELKNPYLDGRDPLDDSRLWYRPHS